MDKVLKNKENIITIFKNKKISKPKLEEYLGTELSNEVINELLFLINNIVKSDSSVDIEENIEADKEDIDSNLTLWNAVQKLNQPYRTTITLFYYEDMSIKEISKITGTNVDAVKKQLSRGREKIKEVINI